VDGSGTWYSGYNTVRRLCCSRPFPSFLVVDGAGILFSRLDNALCDTNLHTGECDMLVVDGRL
jgi:hypothetical protein